MASELLPRARLGTSDLDVSRIALGGMTFGWTAADPASFAIMDAYLEAGGNLIDTSDIYTYWVRGNHGGESERTIGRWLASRRARDQVLIATKARGRMWPGPTGEGLGRDHLIRACDESLRRLRVEMIDLYQFHWPDERVPIEESLRAIEELRRAGKVRHVGLSNYRAQGLAEALAKAADAGLPAPVSLQPHYNLVYREEFETELQALCVAAGVGALPYSPLAKGLLAGRYEYGRKLEGSRANQANSYVSPQVWEVVRAVEEIAAGHGVRPAAVALAWMLSQPGVVAPIVGASSPEQLRDSLAGVRVALSPAELVRLTQLSRRGDSA
jgi:aryl-alcohol dehydrogenase-like predicted oxidoreductase